MGNGITRENEYFKWSLEYRMVTYIRIAPSGSKFILLIGDLGHSKIIDFRQDGKNIWKNVLF